MHYTLTTEADLSDRALLDKVLAIISFRGRPFEPRVTTTPKANRGHARPEHVLTWRSDHEDTWYNLTQGPKPMESYTPNVPAYGVYDAVPDLVTSLASHLHGFTCGNTSITATP